MLIVHMKCYLNNMYKCIGWETEASPLLTEYIVLYMYMYTLGTCTFQAQFTASAVLFPLHLLHKLLTVKFIFNTNIIRHSGYIENI